jgi:hypothetical protein
MDEFDRDDLAQWLTHYTLANGVVDPPRHVAEINCGNYFGLIGRCRGTWYLWLSRIPIWRRRSPFDVVSIRDIRAALLSGDEVQQL